MGFAFCREKFKIIEEYKAKIDDGVKVKEVHKFKIYEKQVIFK